MFDLGKAFSDLGNQISKTAEGIGKSAGELAANAGQALQSVSQNVQIPEINASDLLTGALSVPGVRIDRREFLKKTFKGKCSDSLIDQMIQTSPQKAGVPDHLLKKTALGIIQYETNKTTALSAAAGIPGGFAMAATIPADIAQLYGNMLRVLQKIAYLYGFEEFELNQDQIADETMNTLLILLGTMLGVSQASKLIGTVALSAQTAAAKSIAAKALTKGTIYPIVKKCAKVVGIKMTKSVFAKGVSKAIPIVGAVASGTLTYFTFKPGAMRLLDELTDMQEWKALSEQELCELNEELDDLLTEGAAD